MHVLTIDVPHLGNRTHLVHDGRVGRGDRPAARPDRRRVRREGGGRRHRGRGGDAHPQRLRLRRPVPVASPRGGVPRRGRRGGRVRPHRRARQRDPRLRRHRPPRHRDARAHSAARVLPGDRRHAGDDGAAGALFSGGSLLDGTVGRTDLVDPTLSTALARAQWLSARTARRAADRHLAAPDPRLRQLLRERAGRANRGRGHDRRPARARTPR